MMTIDVSTEIPNRPSSETIRSQLKTIEDACPLRIQMEEQSQGFYGELLEDGNPVGKIIMHKSKVHNTHFGDEMMFSPFGETFVIQLVNARGKTYVLPESTAGIPLQGPPEGIDFHYLINSNMDEKITHPEITTIIDLAKLYHEYNHADIRNSISDDNKDKASRETLTAITKYGLLRGINAGGGLSTTAKDLLQEIHTVIEEREVPLPKFAAMKDYALTPHDISLLFDEEHRATLPVTEQMRQVFSFLELDYERYIESIKKYLSLAFSTYEIELPKLEGLTPWDMLKHSKLPNASL